MSRIPSMAALAAGMLMLVATASGADEDRFAGVSVSTQPLRGGVFMLQGAGGNIGVLASSDGLLMVDDEYAPLAERIQAALDDIAADAAVAEAPRFVLNTHHHGDHSGGNGFFGRTGTIVAHENVRARLVDGGEAPPAALPMVTYADRVRLHMGAETIDLVHLPHGHTDGDSIVFFRAANVVHLGDHFFNGNFPYVDLGSGGSVRGLIDNIAAVLAQLDAEVLIIPGHGPLAGVEDLQAYLTMLEATWATVDTAIASGATDAEIRARGLDARWDGWGKGFITAERWIDTMLREARGARGG
ncbi:MAG TPA: MBL fold metallo-hydrolase [Pseudomonadales bacterium]|nr:MBL fold metallo-hydrolase [Pseudomonadales bacterium]